MPDDSNTLYDRSFFDAQSFDSLRSARAALAELLRHIEPQSVLDVGCGVGAWLRAAGELGVPDCLGVDGDYVDRRALMVPDDRFLPVDLAQPGLAEAVAANRPPPGRFDLVLCLEVAEHLPIERAAGLVDDLCRLGDLVLFSAAIPFQNGTGHINEQWPEFWAIQFRARGYTCFDPLRRVLWARPDVDWWYAQNLLVFAREGSAAHARMPAATAVTSDRVLALVHPNGWLSSILYQWHPHRAAARQEEPEDLGALLLAWGGGAHLPPVLRAVERARNAPAEARDVFPFTRTEVDEPERLLAEAERERVELRTHLDEARTQLAAAEQEARERHAELGETRAELTALRARAATLQAANSTLRGQVARHEIALAEAAHAAAVHESRAREMVALAKQAEAGRAAQEHVAALLATTSWRITAPLRRVRRLLG